MESGVFKLKCVRFKEHVFFRFCSSFYFIFFKTPNGPVSKLTNNRPSNQSKSNGHAGAGRLVASLRSHRPVCVLALKVERVDQPKERGKAITQRKASFQLGGSKRIGLLTPLYCRQIRWQLQQRWRPRSHPASPAGRAGCGRHTCPGASGISPKMAADQ